MTFLSELGIEMKPASPQQQIAGLLIKVALHGAKPLRADRSFHVSGQEERHT